jgi:hypothetical protein
MAKKTSKTVTINQAKAISTPADQELKKEIALALISSGHHDQAEMIADSVLTIFKSIKYQP